ncbi:hypothetical protein ATB99_00125 [Elizabethkingia meningoseptica]|uniref:hypothetical protein n=1 Tax=Elizabethkingia meningoseptica TaxID=238 RepID=UPI000332CE54|nr:hypothetical protein [Elizabethkingia meningoseptica]AQX05742.1 hypothetical protein BBD33_10995 [Elizabethkingia meningoseptica]AQX47785.1 hypothetical protein B5G46_10985 [Elizabethkingia meningoseptica]EOR29219.1 hypothetical protein L100_12458 [Elizabethkingia meningoseptica ATCC 13253 = NBRC 12535]KUY23951.1 hypothetical protein ATB99_00125 [Elizabethkingia meningoseptica]MEC4713257.1 hypothetical protein [Elizabethkingia meningoseptica]
MNKETLLMQVKDTAQEKATHLEQLIESTRASNNDTKSSMGDKYETSREMLQQEINRLLSQLSEVNNQLDILRNMNTKPLTVVGLGAYVETSMGNFYISESLGKINRDGVAVVAVSANAPLVQAMLKKKAGEVFELNGKKQKITLVV